MEINSVRCLNNSISRFVHLVTSCTLKTMPSLKDYESVAISLKLFKPILDNVLENKIASDDNLCRECEELDLDVNNAREFLESWSLKMSKIYGILRSHSLLLRIQSSSLKTCSILCELSESSSFISDLQHCMQELQCLKLEGISEHIVEALKSQKGGSIARSEHLMVVVESLNLGSSAELLRESIVLEKARNRAVDNKMKEELDQIDCIIYFLSRVRDFLLKSKSFKIIDNVDIPSQFCCPLSLELMLDPVIAASGQTYERASIQRWLDHGLTVCPITRQMLTHKNLITNFTVKDMIVNWCENHKIKLSRSPEATKISGSYCSKSVSTQDLIHVDSIPSPLQGRDSTSRSSLEVGYDFENKKADGSSGITKEEFSVSKSREPEKFDYSSPEHSYTHSRSESESSAISSVDYPSVSSTDVSKVLPKFENGAATAGEISSNHSISTMKQNVGCSPLSTGQHHSPKTMNEKAINDGHGQRRTLSFAFDTTSNDGITSSHVYELINDLKSQSSELQTAAAQEIRLLAKHDTDNRIMIGRSGAIGPLISLLQSDVKAAQEHAVTALLNLSINEHVKSIIAEEGALDPLIYVLKTGNSVAKENAAAALFSLSVLEEYRVKIGRSDAVKALVSLLGSGTLRGRKDAATALFNLSIFHENKARIVQAGAVKYLVELMVPEMEMVDKAVALLANLSTISEGCVAIAREGGIPLLVEIVESGTPRGKENAASSLLQLCISSPKYCRLVLQEGAVPPLVALSQSGTTRAKEKAQQLLCHFRNQRDGSQGRRKS